MLRFYRRQEASTTRHSCIHVCSPTESRGTIIEIEGYTTLHLHRCSQLQTKPLLAPSAIGQDAQLLR